MSILSLLKSITTLSIQIVPFSLLIASFGIFLLLRKRNKIGTIFITLGLFSLYTFSLFPISGILLRPLQQNFTRYKVDTTQIEYIVVLGGWHKTNKAIPLTSQLGYDSLTRIIEGIILYHAYPKSTLILSGSVSGADPKSNAEMMARMATQLKVPPKNIIVEERPLNTQEEVTYLKPILTGKKFILITSAYHMQRSIQLFEAQGLSPIPAPVNFHKLQDIPFSLYPSAKALQVSQKAIHEYIGILWAKITTFFKTHAIPTFSHPS